MQDTDHPFYQLNELLGLFGPDIERYCSESVYASVLTKEIYDAVN